MAWTTPVTWTADQLVKAVDFNAQIRDNMNVLAFAIVTATGKIQAINSTYFASLDGSALTGIPRPDTVNTWTEKNDFSAGAIRLPVGANKWAT